MSFTAASDPKERGLAGRIYRRRKEVPQVSGTRLPCVQLQPTALTLSSTEPAHVPSEKHGQGPSHHRLLYNTAQASYRVWPNERFLIDQVIAE